MWAGPCRFVQAGARCRDVESSSEHPPSASATCGGFGYGRTANCSATSATGWGNLSAAETYPFKAGRCEAASGETALDSRFAEWIAFATCAGCSDLGKSSSGCQSARVATEESASCKPTTNACITTECVAAR